jgi:hypothetical protein
MDVQPSLLRGFFSAAPREPRRSARMTHLCSDRVTHTKNRICPRAREETNDIINAEGVRVASPSSAPKVRNSFPASTNRLAIQSSQPRASVCPHPDFAQWQTPCRSAKCVSPACGAGLFLASKVWSFLASAEARERNQRFLSLGTFSSLLGTDGRHEAPHSSAGYPPGRWNRRSREAPGLRSTGSQTSRLDTPPARWLATNATL